MSTTELKTMEEINSLSAPVQTPVGAVEAFTSQLPTAVRASEYSGGIPLVDKNGLERVPFVVQDWSTHAGAGDGDYANIHVMLPNGLMVCFNDGGSGILPVLQAHLEATGRKDGLYCARGLRRSDYITEQTNKPATTYWLT